MEKWLAAAILAAVGAAASAADIKVLSAGAVEPGLRAFAGLVKRETGHELGILDQIKTKTTRYPDGASVMEHVIKSTDNTIGFGAITEIRMYEDKGLKLVGPLPAEVQNYTSYEAAVMSASAQQDAGRAVLKLLASPAGKSAFASGGVE